MYTTSRGAERAWQHQGRLGILTPPCEAGAAELAQLVEQLFRKQQVAGSSPAFGSRLHNTSCRSGETADALRSGRSGGNPVGVQISPSAPEQNRIIRSGFVVFLVGRTSALYSALLLQDPLIPPNGRLCDSLLGTQWPYTPHRVTILEDYRQERAFCPATTLDAVL